eukprot:11226958-Lingulodinium_polyedra.AAC.1
MPGTRIGKSLLNKPRTLPSHPFARRHATPPLDAPTYTSTQGVHGRPNESLRTGYFSSTILLELTA